MGLALALDTSTPAGAVGLGTLPVPPAACETLHGREIFILDPAGGHLVIAERWVWYGHRWVLVTDNRAASGPPLPCEG